MVSARAFSYFSEYVLRDGLLRFSMRADQRFFNLDRLGDRADDVADAGNMAAGNVGILGISRVVESHYPFHRNYPRSIDRRYVEYDKRICRDLDHAVKRVPFSPDL